MRLPAAVILSAVIFWTFGCKDNSSSQSDEQTQQPVETITGTLTVAQQWQGEDIVVAFLPSYFIYHDTDQITGIDGNPPYTITKSVTVTSAAASQQYAIDIPADKNATRELVAWVDMDKDGQLSFTNDEGVRFPRKNYEAENVEVVVTRWTYGINGGDNTFSLVLEEGGQVLTNDFLIDIGGDGFNFIF